MKKHGILNARLSDVIASMGHTDELVICDCGLPVPRNGLLIDLALTKSIPSFIDVLKAVLEELQVEKYIIAEEMHAISPETEIQIKKLLPETKGISMPHEAFKTYYQGKKNIAFVRTGEATPYANIILQSGVVF